MGEAGTREGVRTSQAKIHTEIDQCLKQQPLSWGYGTCQMEYCTWIDGHVKNTVYLGVIWGLGSSDVVSLVNV